MVILTYPDQQLSVLHEAKQIAAHAYDTRPQGASRHACTALSADQQRYSCLLADTTHTLKNAVVMKLTLLEGNIYRAECNCDSRPCSRGYRDPYLHFHLLQFPGNTRVNLHDRCRWLTRQGLGL